MLNPNMQAVSSLDLYNFRVVQGVRHTGRKSLFFAQKNFPVTKIFPNFLKFGLEVLYGVL